MWPSPCRQAATWAMILLASASVDAAVSSTADAAQSAPLGITSTPLPQRAGTPLGPRVPRSVKHGAYNGVVPMLFPANSDAAASGKILSMRDALASVHLDQAGAQKRGLVVQGVHLVRWGDILRRSYSQGISLSQVSPGRLVYEIVATFSHPFAYKGNTWSSGTRTVIIDAATGDALFGSIDGHPTYSAHLQMMRPLSGDHHSPHP